MVAGAEMVVTPVALALTSLSSEKKRLRLFCGNVPTFPAKCFDFAAAHHGTTVIAVADDETECLKAPSGTQ